MRSSTTHWRLLEYKGACKPGRIGEGLLVRRASPSPSPRTSSILRKARFPAGKVSFPENVRDIWKLLGTPALRKVAPDLPAWVHISKWHTGNRVAKQSHGLRFANRLA